MAIASLVFFTQQPLAILRRLLNASTNFRMPKYLWKCVLISQPSSERIQSLLSHYTHLLVGGLPSGGLHPPVTDGLLHALRCAGRARHLMTHTGVGEGGEGDDMKYDWTRRASQP